MPRKTLAKIAHSNASKTQSQAPSLARNAPQSYKSQRLAPQTAQALKAQKAALKGSSTPKALKKLVFDMLF